MWYIVVITTLLITYHASLGLASNRFLVWWEQVLVHVEKQQQARRGDRSTAGEVAGEVTDEGSSRGSSRVVAGVAGVA